MVLHSFSHNSLSKVRLEAIDSYVQKIGQVLLPPFLRCGVREIHRRASRLPYVGLEGSAVRPLHKVPLTVALDKQPGCLTDPRIDPDTHFYAAFVKPVKESAGIGEIFGIKLEIAPCVSTHPEAVKMKDVNGDINITHSVEIRRDGGLVVASQKGRRQPQTIGPIGWEWGSTSEFRVPSQDVFRTRANDDVYLESFARDRHLHFGHFVRLHFVRNVVELIN
jgi:hypothetical protein